MADTTLEISHLTGCSEELGFLAIETRKYNMSRINCHLFGRCCGPVIDGELKQHDPPCAFSDMIVTDILLPED